MNNELDQLYAEVIMDHHRDPRNHGCPHNCEHKEEGFNPLCGDKVLIAVTYKETGDSIRKVYFQGEGCSISLASASIMTEEVEGLETKEALERIESFRSLLQGQGSGNLEGDVLALSGVQKFPVRIKCALLPWMTLKRILESEKGKKI